MRRSIKLFNLAGKLHVIAVLVILISTICVRLYSVLSDVECFNVLSLDGIHYNIEVPAEIENIDDVVNISGDAHMSSMNGLMRCRRY